MNPWIAIALVAGAFYIGTRRRDDLALPAPRVPTPDGPEGSTLPPVGEEVPVSALGAARLVRWDLLPFDADIFPVTASRQDVEPPPAEAGVSVGENCAAIAVGHGFWVKLRDFLQPAIAQGQSTQQLLELVRGSILTSPSIAGCIDDDAPAAMSLMGEIARRIDVWRVSGTPFHLVAGAVTMNGPRRRRHRNRRSLLHVLWGIR